MSVSEPIIRLLSPADDRKGFTCGEPQIDTFFRQFAGQHQLAKLSVTYVVTVDNAIAGFVTTRVGELRFPPLKLRSSKPIKLPRYPLPVLLIAQLGVDTRFTGQGIGRHLVAHTIARAHELQESHGCVAVTTDPLNEKAVTFYRNLGFEPLAVDDDGTGRPSTRPPPMFVTLYEIERAAED